MNTMAFGWDYQPLPREEVANLKPGQPHYGVSGRWSFSTMTPMGAAISGPSSPSHRPGKVGGTLQSPNFSGTLVTAGGLVFWPAASEFMAVDADAGTILWEFQTSAGIVGQPITWERDGKQYVTVTSGATGPYVMRAGDPNLANVPAGGSLWTFKLFEEYAAPQRGAAAH